MEIYRIFDVHNQLFIWVCILIALLTVFIVFIVKTRKRHKNLLKQERKFLKEKQDEFLFDAVLNGSLIKLRFFLEEGMDVNAKSREGVSLLHSAAETGHMAIASFLIEKKININARDNSNQTPLLKAKNFDMIKLLVENGANINAVDAKGMSCLHYASQRGKTDIVKYLVGHGALVNIKDVLGRIPLHEAARNDFTEIVEFLVSCGADINAKDDRGLTPLHISAENRNYDTVKYLLENGAVINAVTKNNETPLYLTENINGDSKVSRLLKDKGGVK
ncbi:MAG: Ankyrin repeats (3 copies) [Elusimicrobia bacterium ADurb.Bin231]|nr:MAG: Ankyrin repeats (3 copies) [Elusimicrobia bacterium ADurb.Bin231]